MKYEYSTSGELEGSGESICFSMCTADRFARRRTQGAYLEACAGQACEQHFYVRMEDAHSLIRHPNATATRAVRRSASLNPGACEHTRSSPESGFLFPLNGQGAPGSYTPFPSLAPQVQPGPVFPRDTLANTRMAAGSQLANGAPGHHLESSLF